MRIISCTGGSASGKTRFVNELKESMGVKLFVINQDNFYRETTKEENVQINSGTYNFDNPDKIDFELLEDVILKIKSGQKVVKIPEYSFELHKRIGFKEYKIQGVDKIIVEGIFVLSNKKIRDLIDIKIYIDTPGDIRMYRRIMRDVYGLKRDLKKTMDYYMKYVIPAFNDYIEPLKSKCNIIINGTAPFDNVISLIR